MPNRTIPPPYKPPKELEELLKQQAAQRKRTAKLPNRNWIQRNPKLFQITFITTSLLVLYSRFIYDAFTETSITALQESVQLKKSE